MTSLMTSALRLSGYLEPSQLPLMEQIKFALTANVSIVGMNVSLMWNSVGFYQIAKLGMIPVSCVLEVFFDRMRYSQGSRLSVLLVLIGVATCTIADSSLSVKGMVAAAVAVCSTALQQYYVQYLQKKYRLGSFDLLSHTAPVQAGSLVLLGPLIDWLLSGARVDSYDFSVPSVLCIGLSCLIAVAVNASQFICIGRFTALTFQGLGHMKTLSVLVLGYALFGLDGLNAPGLGHMKTLSVLVLGYALLGLDGLNALGLGHMKTLCPRARIRSLRVGQTQRTVVVHMTALSVLVLGFVFFGLDGLSVL
ncbi:unnamed protein product [Closterium sp. Naga37s-1]|nr:unnamed protein product [Closterium sp. Naga37s-1]